MVERPGHGRAAGGGQRVGPPPVGAHVRARRAQRPRRRRRAAARRNNEVTETALLADLELAGRHLRELQALGVGVALDDFGTGHTSFTQLRHLPIDTIKIDRSYIATLSNPADNALTRIMADIAHVLGVGVVAEGVERSDQLEALPGLGCGQAQGYLICPPVPPDELTTWIHGRGAPAAGGAVTFDAAAPAVD
ncbi:MAG: EAL domain-containing protein [Acidimicrobiales bacterium]